MTRSLTLAKLLDGPEIFFSIQGEGISIGIPSVFVRCSNCNLKCTWCDTDYTWNWSDATSARALNHSKRDGQYDRASVQVRMTSDQIRDLVRAYNATNVVFTGGEPMMQQRGLAEVAEMLKQTNPDYEFEIETNGTIRPVAELDDRISRYNVSPKLSNAGDPESLRIQPEALRYFATSTKASFKFVCASPHDVHEVRALVEQFEIPRSRVMLMPESTTRVALDVARLWLIETCKEAGWRYSDRLHVAAYDSRRGT